MLSWLRYLYFTETLLFVIPYGVTFYLLPLFLLLPIRLCWTEAWWAVERNLYKTFAYLVPFYPNRRRYNLKAYGQFKKLQKILETQPDDCGIVLVNHQTAVDISTLIQFWGGISKKINGWGNVSWIQDYLLGVLPSGWVSKVHGDFFVLQSVDVNKLTKCTQCHRSSKTIRQRLEINLRNHSKNIFKRHRFLQFFPEGGFFLRRKEGARRFSEKNDLPVFDHVATPRTTGMAAIMNELSTTNWLASPGTPGKKVKYCVVLTVAYPDQQQPWSVFQVMAGPILSKSRRQDCYIHVKVMPVTDVPLPKIDPVETDREGNLVNKKSVKEKMQEPFEQWLLREFLEMDKVLAEFYSNDSEEVDSLGSIYDMSLSTFWLWFHYLASVTTGLCWVAGIVCLCLYA